MPYVVLTDLRPGLQKVPLTNAIRTHTGAGLAKAKGYTDRYVGGETVRVPVASMDAARRLASAAAALGAAATVEADTRANVPTPAPRRRVSASRNRVPRNVG
jgi:ribosomal protein L7/L12